MRLGKYRKDINSYTTLTQDKKNIILKIMNTLENMNQNSYMSLFLELIPKLDYNTAFTLFKNYLNNNLNNKKQLYNLDYFHKIILNLYLRSKDKENFKIIIRSSKQNFILRTLIMFNNISLEDEETGLRAIVGTKYVSNIIYHNKYTPTVAAIKKLPPIMRLNVLEALLNNPNIAYNLFKNFKDSDEFKSILFGAVLKYRNRVEIVWEKYQEIINFGIKSTILLKGLCINCGEYNISINSTRMRTFSGFKKTHIGVNLLNNSCALCGVYEQKEKQFIYEDSK